MRNFIRRIILQTKLESLFAKEAWHFWRFTRRYNASNHTDKDIEKMQYTLSRETHTIEKGMSMRNPRKGFGQEKVSNLINRLKKYNQLYGMTDSSFLYYPLSTIKSYIEYTNKTGVSIPDIEESYAELLNTTDFELVNVESGIVRESKEHIQSLCNKDFESLLFSRHSLRYFSKRPVSKDILDKALILAQRTPSACNRQGWKAHVFMGNRSVELIRCQGGSRGFEDEIRCAILVTANLKAFLSFEVHQAYVDGGLYAMNLINALHSLGLGTIPLSTAFQYQKLAILKSFGIPENEVPILIIGVGHLLDEFNVAVSTRKDIVLTTIWH